MGAGLDIRIDSDLKAAAARFEVRVVSQLESAAARAINRSISSARTEAVKQLRAAYPGVKARTLRARLRMQRARRGDLAGALVFSGRRFSYFGNFPLGLKRTKYGTGVRVPNRLPFGLQTSGGAAVTAARLASAFVQRSRTHRRPAVWLRTGPGRMPIEPVVALGVSRAFVERRLGLVLSRVVRARFQAVLNQELKFRTGA